MGEELRLSQPCRIQPAPRPVGTSPQSFELLHGPSDEMIVDARSDGVQLGAVEGPVVDPAPDLGVDPLGEAVQVRAAATAEVTGSDLAALRLSRRGAHGRKEAHEESIPAFGQAGPKGVAEEVEPRVLGASPAAFLTHSFRFGPGPGCSRMPCPPDLGVTRHNKTGVTKVVVRQFEVWAESGFATTIRGDGAD